MQCSWQKLARLASPDASARPWPATHFFRSPSSYNPATRRSCLQSFREALSRRRNFSTAKAISSASAHLLPLPISPNIDSPTLDSPLSEPGQLEGESISKSLSSAELSRAAARAVRISIQNGNLADAYLIVNSVRYAGVLHTASELPGIDSMEHFRSVALAFTSDVSPRLPSHALLHGLLRHGMPDKASSLAEQMMSAGINVRCKTLEVIFDSLAEMSSADSATGRGLPPTAFALENSDVLTLNLSMTSDRATQFALRLLYLARKSRQRRSHNMFKTLITLCVINGEIILASLLFGYMLRDWQARELQNSDVPSHYDTPRPVHNRMKAICELADSALAEDRKDEHVQLQFKSALQALANLAHLLDRRLIPFSNITPILHSLSNCPRTSAKVWVPDENGVPQYIEAYPYFHEVLERLIHSLPRHSPRHDPVSLPHSKDDMMIPMARATYHSLLHYALRHRQSLSLAETLIDHMSHIREPPLEPDNITKNIVMRSQQLLRRHNITGGLLFELARPMATQTHSASVSDSSPPPDDLCSLANTRDNYALSMQIAHLTATNRVKAVVQAIPSLLPGLTLSFYPQGKEDMTPEQVKRIQMNYRQDGLQRAVELGPIVLTAILNALQKDGRTAYAEKVWLWAKEAETLSWSLIRNERIEPWCLPVSTYTIMIKVYAAEAGKQPGKNDAGLVRGWGRNTLRIKRKRSGRFVANKHWKKTPRLRSNLGRRKGLLVYGSLWTNANKIRKRLLDLQSQDVPVLLRKRQLEIPRPDIRFFNSVLKIVGKRKNMAPRRILYGKSHYARLIRKTRARYIRGGRLPLPPPDPALVEVANDMKTNCIPVPLLFQKLLIGRWDGAASTKIDRRDRRPFAAESELKKGALEEVGITTIPVVHTKRTTGSTRRKIKVSKHRKKRSPHPVSSN